MRTINRVPFTVNQYNYKDLGINYFNHTNWKGICDDINYLNVDQETFSEANNVYVDKEGLLRSRPSLKASSQYNFNTLTGTLVNSWNFRILESSIEKVMQVYQLENNGQHKLYLYVDGALRTTNGIAVGANCTLMYLESLLFIFTDNNFLCVSFDGTQELVAQSATPYVYIPETEIIVNGVVTENESKNALTTYEKHTHLYGNYSTADGTIVSTVNWRSLLGKTVDIKVGDTLYEGIQISPYIEDTIVAPVGAPQPDIINNVPLVSINDYGQIVLRSNNIIYYSAAGKIYTALPTYYTTNHNIIGIPTFSADGKYIILYSVERGILLYDCTLPIDSWHELHEFVEDYTHIAIESNGAIGWNFNSVNDFVIIYQTRSGNKIYIITYYNQNYAENEINFTPTRSSDDSQYIAVNYLRNSSILYVSYKISERVANMPSTSVRYYCVGDVEEEAVSGVISGGIGRPENYRSENIVITSTFDSVSYSTINTITHKYLIGTSIIDTPDTAVNYIVATLTATVESDNTIAMTESHTTSELEADASNGAVWYDDIIVTNNKIYYPGSRSVPTALDDTLIDIYPLYFGYGVQGIHTLYYIANGSLYSNYDLPLTYIYETIEGTYNYLTFNHVAELNNYYFSSGNTLYISEEKREDTEYRWYLPEIAIEKFQTNITNLHPLSQQELGIFLNDEIWVVSYNSELSAYYYTKSKVQVGCLEGSDVITSIDGKYIIFSCSRGLVALTYQDFIASTDQVLMTLSDNIFAMYEQYNKFNTEPIKLWQYKYWLIVYNPNNTNMYLYDYRNNSWWMWTIPVKFNNLFVINGDIFFVLYRSVCGIDLSDNNYKDVYNKNGTSRDIEWHFMSQRLHFNNPNYYKHIDSISLHAMAESQVERSMQMQVSLYRSLSYDSTPSVIPYNIDILRTFIKRCNYSKIQAFQYKLYSDTGINKNGPKYPFNLSALSIKYNITSQVR